MKVMCYRKNGHAGIPGWGGNEMHGGGEGGGVARLGEGEVCVC